LQAIRSQVAGGIFQGGMARTIETDPSSREGQGGVKVSLCVVQKIPSFFRNRVQVSGTFQKVLEIFRKFCFSSVPISTVPNRIVFTTALPFMPERAA
jgi:hypothetical protein